jgi:hypothetical protein
MADVDAKGQDDQAHGRLDWGGGMKRGRDRTAGI